MRTQLLRVPPNAWLIGARGSAELLLEEVGDLWMQPGLVHLSCGEAASAHLSAVFCSLFTRSWGLAVSEICACFLFPVRPIPTHGPIPRLRERVWRSKA